MPFPIEILTTEKELLVQLSSAIQPLNVVQAEFSFHLANDWLLSQSYTFQLKNYTNEQVYKWLKDYKKKAGGNKPYIILVITKPLQGRFNNLFGSHKAEEGLAWFTMDSFEARNKQFLFDKIRFCRYYLVRYALSFVEPGIKAHPTKGCMFDDKIDKRDILLSLATGEICDDCFPILRASQYFNVDVSRAITSLLGVVSNQHPRALVMKGGGVKGLALVGALKELEKYFTFDTFSGTSAGAIAATLLGAGYSPTELENVFREKNFLEFRDPWYKRPWNIVTKRGFHSGKHFKEWLDTLLKKKIHKENEITMADLPSRAIVYATQVGGGLIRFDSHGKFRDSTAAFATRCSMSIPLFFVPEKIEGVKVYDGGLGYNFPLRTFIADNGNSLFIGLYLKSDVKKDGNLYTDMREITTDSDERQVVDANLDKVVIIDPRPIKTKQFKLSQAEKDYLVQAGKVGALEYLSRYHGDLQISFHEVERERTNLVELRNKLTTQETLNEFEEETWD